MYKLATEDGKGNKLADGKINTNPNVSRALPKVWRPCCAAAPAAQTSACWKIEEHKRSFMQNLLDNIKANHARVRSTPFPARKPKNTLPR